jgi:3',5'-nucleoside bisphosphate phosphatase
VIDFHAHTLYSDGTDTPERLALLGDEAGLSALALTDHDTVDGIPEFLAMQSKVKPRLIVGTELSCQFLGRSLHMLGLFVNHEDERFLGRLNDLRARRDDRNQRLVLRLQALGFHISLEDVQQQANSSLLSRMHFAKALATKKYVRHPQDAFEHLLGDEGRAFVPREELEPEEAARWIREAGGIPLVAHPGRFGGKGFAWNEAMRDLQRRGLEGFEGYYGEYQPAQQRYFTQLAADLDMVLSGGSDYHGANKPGLRLGVGRGGLKVPDELLPLLEARRDRGSWN